MEKRVINPWQWQDARSYVQAVEIKQPQAVLYVAGQAAVDEHGGSSAEDMRSQLLLAIANLEKVIREAGYEPSGIVRLNIYTTSAEELLGCFDVFQDWVAVHGIKQASTLLEVQSLFDTLTVELEATVVR